MDGFYFSSVLPSGSLQLVVCQDFMEFMWLYWDPKPIQTYMNESLFAANFLDGPYSCQSVLMLFKTHFIKQ